MYHLHSFMRMDRHSATSVTFNTYLEIRVICRSKLVGREFLIHRFGESFYQDLNASTLPFILPIIRREWFIVVFVFY